MHARTLDEVIQPFLHLPVVVQNAILRAETHPSFSVLTKSGKAILKQLLTRVNKSNGQLPIRARIDVVADKAGVSYKTVQRTLSVLKKLGWLEVLTTGRSEWGMFTSHEYRFTRELCDLVQVPNGNKIDRETKMSNGYIYDLTFKKDQQEIFFKNKDQKTIELPVELEEIVALDVKASGVCKLRGMATEQGYSLEDIWVVAKKRLMDMKATGQRVYRYLQAMILKRSDYKARAEQERRLDTNKVHTSQTTDGWWKTASGIIAKGTELGLIQTEEIFAYFRDRVFHAAGDGPWLARSPATVIQNGLTHFASTNISSKIARSDAIKSIRQLLKE